jgi:hypothetical protein
MANLGSMHLTERRIMDDKNNDRPAIRITPEMTEAGLAALRIWNTTEDDPDWIIEDVFEAMMRVALKQGQFRVCDPIPSMP